MLLGYGVKPDHEDQYHGVWHSITHSDSNDRSEKHQKRSIDTLRLLFDDYEEKSYLLRAISTGVASFTGQHRSSIEAVWLFHQSEAHLVGPELANFQDAVLSGVLINCIWDMNWEGLEWIKDILHTPAGARLCEKLSSGDFRLLDTFFADRRLAQPRRIGTDITSALLLLGIDVEACLIQEFLQVPFGVVKTRSWPRKPLLDKRVTFLKEGEHSVNLEWEWIHDQSAPGHLLVSELTAFTVDSDHRLIPSPEEFVIPNHPEHSPLYSNRHDTAQRYSFFLKNSGKEKWPPRFARRAAKKERKERARLGQKQVRSIMPGTWVP